MSGSIKIRGAGWRKFDKARLHISVGHGQMEGDDLKRTLGWMGAHFASVTICVNDTLQRYNFDGAEAAGREWIERNIDAIRVLPSFNIVRWNSWLTHPDFEVNLANMERAYCEDSSFRREVDTEAETFWRRRGEGDKATFCRRSVAYLLEECAAFTIMFRTPAADIYSGSTLLPCRLFKQNEGARGFTRVEPRAA